ncbi:MAG TPA: VCBS repeat-containing protein [Actinoplanes sp.]|nr:VCBS repeat-containing protein [Actinoplanes sp.]
MVRVLGGPQAGSWVVSAVAVAAAALYPASPAAAAPVLGLAAPAKVAPCGPGGVSAADEAVADQVRSSMNGKRLGRAVNGRGIACARAIVATVQARGLGFRAAVIALTTAIAESTLNNHTVALDHDSLGLFQQRPSQGWGRVDQLIDPVYSTNAFLSSMLRKFPGNRWMTGDIGAICQRVQVSAFPLAYTPEAHDAEVIAARLWGSPARTPDTSTATAADPAGPYQKALIVRGAELGPLGGRHELALTDWNGDGRPDLTVVKGTGTVTGKTEVRVLDGASEFANLLLDSATALGPTDETYSYAFTDFNGDKKPDLVVARRSSDATGGLTEVSVLDGASAFRRFLVPAGTVPAVTGAQHRFGVADWNADGKPDLVITQTEGTASRKMEVQVLDGAANFQRHQTPTIITSEPADTGRDVIVTEFNGDRKADLAIVEKATSAAGKTQITVLDGASGLQTVRQSADTAPGASAHLDILVTAWNEDKKPDVMMVQKTGTASGRAELVILGG